MTKLSFFLTAVILLISFPLMSQYLGSSTTFHSSIPKYVPAYNAMQGDMSAQLSYSKEYFSRRSGYSEYNGAFSYRFQNSHVGATLGSTRLGIFSMHSVGLFYSYKINMEGYHSRQQVSFAITPTFLQTSNFKEFLYRDKADVLLDGNTNTQSLFDLGISVCYKLELNDRYVTAWSRHHTPKRSISIGLALANMVEPIVNPKKESAAGIPLPRHLYSFFTYHHPVNRSYGIEGGVYTSLTQNFDMTSSGIITAHHHKTNLKVGVGYSTAQRLMGTASVLIDNEYSDNVIEIGALVTYNMRNVINTYSQMSVGVQIQYKSR